jgi:hypothetical protein
MAQGSLQGVVIGVGHGCEIGVARKGRAELTKLKLTPDLVPKPLWGKNAHQLFGRRALWKKIRSETLEAAHHACEVCSLVPSPIHGDRLTCHEVWHYDEKRCVATLTGLRIHCTKCDSAVHMGMAARYGGQDMAIAQLCKVNGSARRKRKSFLPLKWFFGKGAARRSGGLSLRNHCWNAIRNWTR